MIEKNFNIIFVSLSQVEEQEYFRPGALGKVQKCMWDMFEKPHTSFGAKVLY
jgi:hypothetical protein